MSETGKSILIVEDNADDEALIVRALSKNRLANDIVIRRDGAEALHYLLGRDGMPPESATLPQVVLLDLKLPKIDGLEVLKRLRGDERTRNLPIVILTSSDEESDRLRGYQLRANSYVQKPVEFQAFMDAVRDLGLYWLVLNRPPPD